MLSSSDIFVMLSESGNSRSVEGFGIAILEAYYHHTPAIGSKGTGIEDAILHGVTGSLVDPFSEQEIVAAVEAVIKNLDSFSERAYQFSLDYTWDVVVHKYIKEIDLV